MPSILNYIYYNHVIVLDSGRLIPEGKRNAGGVNGRQRQRT